MGHEQLTQILSADPTLRLAILFGSVASGEVRPDSDIDIAIAGDTPLTAQAKLALIETIAQHTGRPVDLVDLRTAGEPLLGQILRKGVRLVMRDSRLLAKLISHHLMETEDFLPYRRRILEKRRQAWIGK